MAKMGVMNMIAQPPDLAIISALQTKLVSALRPILPEDGLLWEPEDCLLYTSPSPRD